MQNVQNFPLSSSVIDYQCTNLALTIFNEIVIKDSTGGTFNFDSVKVNFIEGYLVSYFQPSIILDIDQFLNLKIENLAELIKKLYFKCTKFDYIGFWVDNKTIYIDLSTNILNKSQAIQHAIYNKQLAIWDCLNNEVIYIENYKL